MQKDAVNILIDKYLEDRLEEGERQQLSALLKDPAAFKLLDELVLDLLVERTYAFEPDPAIQASIQQYLDQHTQLPQAVPYVASPLGQPVRPGTQRLRRWLSYAAAVMLLCATAGYIWVQQQQQSALPLANKQTQVPAMDIPPGSEGAILTLEDGTQLVLDSLNNGVIATQQGAHVILENGQLGYTELPNSNLNARINTTEPLSYNTMTTPKGRQFHMKLPDGTKLWLNAMSSVKYPTVFTGTERRIEITGEAYVEVTPNTRQPFIVNINNKATVQVLGTSFNINAYENEASINTTLLEGSVKISAESSGAHKNVILKPGQQAKISNHPIVNNAITVTNSNSEKTLAWKNGSFNFDGVKLEAAMRQLSRWYDIEVVYEKGIPNIEFIGSISRSFTLNEIIKALEMSNVHFRLEAGRRLVVLP